jgi:hypothetical protein
MVRVCCIYLAILAVPAFAQAPQAPSGVSSVSDNLADNLRWAAALKDKLSRMQDPVVALYGKARLAALVCAQDKATGAKVFQEALKDLKSLPDDAFDTAKTPLPVSTFTAMWKLVVPAAQSCDPDSAWGDESLDERRRGEVDKKPDFWLNKALDTPNPDRAAQLADAAISVGFVRWGPILTHFRSPDLILFVDVLIKLAATAPDLTDALFQKATDLHPHQIAELEMLAKYLFPAAPSVRLEIDPRFVPSTDNPATRPMVPDFMGTPLHGNLDVAVAFLNTSARAVGNLGAISVSDLPGAYTLAYQMLPKARLYAPEHVFAFQNAMQFLETQPGAYAAKNRANIGPPPEMNSDEPAPHGEFLSVAKALSDIRAGRFVAARRSLFDLGDTAVRRQVEALIDFGEAAEALPTQNGERVLGRPNCPGGGAKCALLYASISSTAGTREGGLQALRLALKDAQPLPAAPRACLLTALAGAALSKAPDEALGILRQSIEAENDASSQTGESGGDSSDGGPAIRCGPVGLVEEVDTGEGRQSILLRAPGLSTYTISGLLAQARKLDFPRLESAAQELRDPAQLAEALVALAELRLNDSPR